MEKKEEYRKIHLLDFPISNKFYIEGQKGLIKLLMIRATEKVGSRRLLCKFFRDKCGYKKCEYLLSKWKHETRRIHLDCFIELIRLLKEDIKEIEKKVKLYCYCSNALGPFPIIYDENLAMISECIRVEGSMPKNATFISLSNKDVTLLRNIKKGFKELYSKIKFNQSLRVAFKIGDNIRKEDIRVYNKDKSFNTSVKPFISGGTISSFLDTQISFGTTKEYFIHIKKRKYKIKVIIPEKSSIEIKSNLRAFACIQLIIPHMMIRHLFNLVLEIPIGKKSYDIKAPSILLNSQLNIIKKTLAMVYDCEGYFTFVKPPKSVRMIGLNMVSKDYICGIKKLLSKIGIKSYINQRPSNIYRLAIYGKQNILSFKQQIKMITERKQAKLEEISVYRELLGEEGENLCKDVLEKNNQPMSVKEVAIGIGLCVESARNFLNRLLVKKKVNLIRSKPFKYSIN